MERKLCTILALDVVGFSKMMATDEDQTLKVLNSRREFIDACINDHGGVFLTRQVTVFWLNFQAQ